MNGACIAQMLKVTELLKNTCHMQQELLNSLRLFFCYVNHRWGMWCNVVQFATNVQAPLFCYQLEAAMRLCIMVNSIQEDAQRHGMVADRVLGAHQREQSRNAEVTALADTIGGTMQPAPAPTAEQQQEDADMDTTEERDGSAMGGTGAQQAGSLGPASKDVNKA